MKEKELQYQDQKLEKKLTLEEELQNQLAKTMGLESFSQFNPMQNVKNAESEKIEKKLQGLTLLKNRVKAQGSVVAADMLTPELESEYKTQYGLSQKELERMLNEMQQGQVKDFELGENEYARMQTRKRSKLSQQENAGQSEVYRKLGDVLYRKRQEQNMASFQLVSLEEETTQSFQEEYRLSKKELNKISLDIQTRAVSVEEYGNMLTIEEERVKLREEAEEKVRKEEARQEKIDQGMQKIKEDQERGSRVLAEQPLRENAEKREARLNYLKTGITKEFKPENWILGEYAQEAEQILEANGDPVDIEIVKKHAKEMMRNLVTNRIILNDKVTEKLEKYRQRGLPVFLYEQTKTEMTSAFEKTYRKQILEFNIQNQAHLTKEENQDSLEEILAGMLQNKEKQLQKWVERRERIQAEIGQSKIDVTLVKRDEIKKLYELDDEKFEESLKQLAAQTINVKRVKMVLEERFSTISREKIFEDLMEKYGEKIFFSAPSNVYALLKEYLEQLPKETKEFEENVNIAKETFIKKSPAYDSNYMSLSNWDRLIAKALNISDPKKVIDEKLKKLAENVLINIASFSYQYKYQEMADSVWEQLYEYRDEIVHIQQQDFQKMIEQKKIELLQIEEEKNPEKIKKISDYETALQRYKNINMVRDGKEDFEDIRNQLSMEDRFSNVAQLKGPELLGNWEFEIALQEHHDLVLRVLNEILENEKDKQKLGLDCLEEVECLEDLNNLSYSQLQMVIGKLRQNLRNENLYIEVPKYKDKTEMLMETLAQVMEEKGMDIEDYLKLSQNEQDKIMKDEVHKKLGTGNMDEIEIPMEKQAIRMVSYWDASMGRSISKAKEKVMKQMLIGEFRNRTFSELKEKMDEAVEEQQRNTDHMKKTRARFFMTLEKDKARTGAKLEDFPKDSYVGKNKDKFEDACKAWRMIREAGEEEMAFACCREGMKAGYSSAYYKECNDNPLTALKNLLRKIDKVEGEKLAGKLDRGSRSSFFNEFLMCDYMEFCQSMDIHPKISDMMTKKRENNKAVKDGEKELYDVGVFMLNSVEGISDALKKQGLSSEYREQLIPWAMKLYGKNKDERIKSLGVSETRELVQEFKKQIQNDKDMVLENQINRYHKLLAYDNGILKPVLPVLLEDDDFWIKMATKSETEFFAEIKQLLSDVRRPLEILQKRYSSLGATFYEELCHKFAKEILLGDEQSKVQWIQNFDHFFKGYSEEKLGNFSIRDFTMQLEKKNPRDPVIPYVTEILLSQEKGIALAANPKELHETLDRFREPIQTKKTALENEIQNYLATNEEFQIKQEETTQDVQEEMENKKEAFRRGCYLYLQKEIVHEETAVFLENLKQWMDKYLARRAELLKDTKEVEERMSASAKKLQDIHAHWDAGMEAAGKDFARFSEVRTNVHTAGSPLLAAFEVKKRPGKAQIIKAKEKVEKDEALKKMELPQAVKDCLQERILTKVDDKTLHFEAKWLNTVYTVASQYMSRISEKQRKLIPSEEKMLSEVLLYAYILNRRVQNVDKDRHTMRQYIEPDETLVKECFEQLISRHQSMSELLDDNYTQAVELQQVLEGDKEELNIALKKEENPVLASQRHLVMESMAAGLYTMEQGEFKELLERQRAFLEAAGKADVIFEKLVNQHVEEKDRVKARRALIDYFRADLMPEVKAEQKQIKAKEFNTIEIQEKAEQILTDEVYRKCLLTGVLLEETGKEETSGKYIPIAEKTMHTVANREMLECYLYQNKESGLIGYGGSTYGIEYRQLTPVQRQIFALAVLQWDEKEMLPSMQFVTSKELEESRYITVTKQLEDYAWGEELPKMGLEIPYDRVIDRLCMGKNREINKEVFDFAMKQTKAYIDKRQRNRPKDYQFLNDTAYSTKTAKMLLKYKEENSLSSNTKESETVEKEVSVSSVKEWKEWIGKQLETEKEKLSKNEIKEMQAKLEKLNDEQYRILTLALHDRTMLDYTTYRMDGKPVMEYVNKEKREMFQEYYQQQDTEVLVYRRDLQKAVQTLQSYQLRDDLELHYGDLRESDFAEDALMRDTKIDWQLLNRAMDFANNFQLSKIGQ